MIAHASSRLLYLRVVAGLLLLCVLANLLLVFVGKNLPALRFSYTLPQDDLPRLYVRDINSGLSFKVTDEALACCPLWSPDQNMIAFMDVDGTTLVWDWRDGSTRSLGRIEGRSKLAGWSPDSRAIIETASSVNNPSGSSDFYRVDVATAAQTRLVTIDKASIYGADWSPDGKFIVFMARIDYQEFIYRMDSDGQNLRQLAVPVETILVPKISPDSQRILFVSARDGIPGLFIMNADGTDQKKLIGVEILGDLVASPDWSPDSTHILYQSVQHNSGNFRQMRVALDGSLPVLLAAHPAMTAMPFCLLPDGSTMLYEADDLASAEIQMLDLRNLEDRTLLQADHALQFHLAC